ncbi:prenyltransferase/squalene oxidase repeat-containing protein [Streptomyces bauhiniae]|uniref:prenyltransferase/squalene oxidase repeat-containing protein n=1 Tax=Streptomyces bauhiniae TaxID=2340725 RepID=UPI00366670FC
MLSVPSGYRRGSGRAATAFLLLSTVGVSLWTATLPAHAAPASAAPDLKKGTAYLVAPAQLTDGHYYQPFGGGFADFGLTIDGAYALAATRQDDAAFTKIVQFLDEQKADGTGRTINDWTGIGTEYASGGSLGKEALLAEVAGKDPRAFGGHDLIAALDDAVCAEASTGTDTTCAAPGSYAYSPSVFSQSLAIMAQLRAGDTANAAAPIAYLKGLQQPGGAWPSLIPATADSDVDSTAMAVMALALLPDDADASAAVAKGVAWIAQQQKADGGFPGAAGDSTNSAALAVQALTLDKSAYTTEITKTLAFLASQQNPDGGFNVAAGGQPGSDVRASTQAVGGATGISFGTLLMDTPGSPPPTDATSPSPTPTSASPTPSHTAPPTPTSTAAPTISTIPDTSTPSDAATSSAPAAPIATDYTPTTGTDGQLAATGTDARTELLLTGALLSVGGAAITGARRKRASGSSRHR